MYYKKHSIAILWSGIIDDPSVLEDERIVLFQMIGIDDVQRIISQLDFSAIDAVITPPGIAAEVRQLIPVPLVVAYPNYIDILETVKYAEISRGLRNRKLALILHEGNRIEEQRLDYFIHNTVELYKYASKDQIRQICQNILAGDYALVFGGPTAVNMAKSFNIEAVQLIYRAQAVQDALEKAREILFLMDREIRQAERLKAIIDVIPDGLVETDAQGTIGMCNKRALEMLDLPPDSVLGRDIGRLLGDPSWEAVYRDNTAQMDTLLTYKGGKFFSTRVPILESGEVIGSVGTLQRAERIQGMESKYRSHQMRGLVARHVFSDIISQSAVMNEVIERAKVYTQNDMTILLEGETGTGKEIFAQSIHNASARRRGPFVAVNCAALTETLLESELMGYDEGAFTGAKKGGKIGLFEQAHTGTIFLDEINQLSPALQAKLLRVIQEKAVRHVGGDGLIPVDVRIIAATNENLKEKIAEKTFRSDLYYRVNVLNILLPPLRERREDIPALMLHFAGKIEPDAGTAKRHVAVMRDLVKEYDWPGNVRELRNFIERYMALNARSDTLERHFFQDFQGIETTRASAEVESDEWLRIPAGTLDAMETALVRAVVERCGGNKSKAALLMDISRNTVHQRLKEG